MGQDHLLYTGRIQGQADEEPEFRIELVDSPGQRALICALLDRMYGWRGYKGGSANLKKASSYTFAATRGSEIVATLTLNVDKGDGLAADRTFSDTIADARRKPGAQLCELVKFASLPSEHSKHVLACLFHTIFIFGTERFGCTDLFIEVNPRHVRFYESMLGFRRCGGLRNNASVEAPAQLMRLQIADLAKHIECRAIDDNQMGTKSLYPLFLAASEQRAVRDRTRDSNPTFKGGAYRSNSALIDIQPADAGRLAISAV